MQKITANVDWVDDDICQTRIDGQNLPEGIILEMSRWVLALELGCATEELDGKGWMSEPDGPRWEEWADGQGWILDWRIIDLDA